MASSYFAGMFLRNIKNCLYRHETTLYFKCKPPFLEAFWRSGSRGSRPEASGVTG